MKLSAGEGRVDVDVDGEGDLAAEDALQFASGELADLLHPLGATANKHPLIAFVRDENGGIDAESFGMGGGGGHDLDSINVDAAAVGDFVLGLKIDLFAYDLGDLEVAGGIGGVGRRIEWRGLGEELNDEIDEFREAGTGGAGDVEGMLVGRGE